MPGQVITDEPLPPFLSHELLAKVLGGPVKDVAATPMGPGNGFASSMLNVKVTLGQGGQERVQNVLVKRMPESKITEVFPIRRAFEVEARVYSEILPRMMALLKSINKEQPPLGPRMLHGVLDTDQPILYMEDIGSQGFRLASRDEGLDVAHARLVLRSIARWHAATAKLLEDKPDLFMDLKRMASVDHAVLIDNFLVKGFKRFVKHIERWEDECSRRLYPKLKLLAETLRERILAANEPDKDGLNVGLHGDLWTGNMLFKYGDDGKPVEVRLIDYQIAAWGSLASDLLYFQAACGIEARRQREQLFAEYHAELTECLTALGVRRVPTAAEFKADIVRRGIIEVVHVSAGAALIMAPVSMGLTVSMMLELPEWEDKQPHPKEVAMEREPFVRLMAEYFAAWEREGLLDALIAQRVD